MSDLIAEVKRAIVDGNDDLAAEKVRTSLAAGTDPDTVLTEGVVAGIDETGNLWAANEYFLSDVILSAAAFKAAMKEQSRHLAAGRAQRRGLVVPGTI